MTLATALPEIVPKAAEETTDTFPGPPVCLATRRNAMLRKNFPRPVRRRKAPRMRKRTTKEAIVARGVE
jgi:hypothetical protein